MQRTRFVPRRAYDARPHPSRLTLQPCARCRPRRIRSVKLWSVADQGLRYRCTVTSHTQSATCVAWSDGAVLASASMVRARLARTAWRSCFSRASLLSFLPAAATIGTPHSHAVLQDGSMAIHDPRQPQRVAVRQPVVADGCSILSVAWIDAHLVACGCDDGRIVLADIRHDARAVRGTQRSLGIRAGCAFAYLLSLPLMLLLPRRRSTHWREGACVCATEDEADHGLDGVGLPVSLRQTLPSMLPVLRPHLLPSH